MNLEVTDPQLAPIVAVVVGWVAFDYVKVVQPSVVVNRRDDYGFANGMTFGNVERDLRAYSKRGILINGRVLS